MANDVLFDKNLFNWYLFFYVYPKSEKYSRILEYFGKCAETSLQNGYFDEHLTCLLNTLHSNFIKDGIIKKGKKSLFYKKSNPIYNSIYKILNRFYKPWIEIMIKHHSKYNQFDKEEYYMTVMENVFNECKQN